MHAVPPPAADDLAQAYAAIRVRDPAPLLREARSRIEREGACWVFGYASLIWRPEFEAVECRPARVHGWHRALRMRSRVNRGTPEVPGLVFALLHGGACRGVAWRLAPERAGEELELLWAREMPTGVYDPRWLRCDTAGGTVHALAFTLARQHEALVPPLDDAALLAVLRHARGRFGTTLDYLLETHRALVQHGIRDREIERLVRFARRHGLA
jgi:cation transport protein ChaC